MPIESEKKPEEKVLSQLEKRHKWIENIFLAWGKPFKADQISYIYKRTFGILSDKDFEDVCQRVAQLTGDAQFHAAKNVAEAIINAQHEARHGSGFDSSDEKTCGKCINGKILVQWDNDGPDPLRRTNSVIFCSCDLGKRFRDAWVNSDRELSARDKKLKTDDGRLVLEPMFRVGLEGLCKEKHIQFVGAN